MRHRGERPTGHFTPAGARPLRLCAVGNTQWLGHNSPSFGGRFFCPRHQRELFEGFDPRPRDKTRKYGPVGDHTVRMIDGGWPTPDTPYVVLAREGDRLQLRQVGMPDREPVWHSIGAVWPDRYGYFSKRCGS